MDIWEFRLFRYFVFTPILGFPVFIFSAPKVFAYNLTLITLESFDHNRFQYIQASLLRKTQGIRSKQCSRIYQRGLPWARQAIVPLFLPKSVHCHLVNTCIKNKQGVHSQIRLLPKLGVKVHANRPAQGHRVCPKNTPQNLQRPRVSLTVSSKISTGCECRSQQQQTKGTGQQKLDTRKLQ